MKRTIPKQPACKRPTQKRRGVAAVEFVACIPLFVLLTIGAIQTTDAIYLRNSLRVVAYETVRTSVDVGSTNTEALARANEIITARNVQDATVTFSPSDISTATPGQPITVTVFGSGQQQHDHAQLVLQRKDDHVQTRDVARMTAGQQTDSKTPPLIDTATGS